MYRVENSPLAIFDHTMAAFIGCCVHYERVDAAWRAARQPYYIRVSRILISQFRYDANDDLGARVNFVVIIVVSCRRLLRARNPIHSRSIQNSNGGCQFIGNCPMSQIRMRNEKEN